MRDTTRVCDLPDFPFQDVRITGLLLGISKDMTSPGRPYVLHMTDFSKPNYNVSLHNGSMATCYDFLRLVSGRKAEFRGRDLRDWTDHMFDVICFNREFNGLKTLIENKTHKDLSSEVCYYDMMSTAGLPDGNHLNKGSEKGVDYTQDALFENGERTFIAHYSPTTNEQGTQLDKAGIFVSICVKANVYKGTSQLKAVMNSVIGGGFFVHNMTDPDEDVLDPGIMNIVADWRKLLGVVQTTNVAIRPKKLTNSSNNESQRVDYVENANGSKLVGDIAPAYTPLSVLEKVPTEQTGRQTSYLVYVAIDNITTDIDSEGIAYRELETQNWVCRDLEVEIVDSKGQKLEIAVLGKDVPRFVQINAPKGSFKDVQEEFEMEFRSRVKEMVLMQKKEGMLIRKVKLALGGTNSAYIPIWRWMFTDPAIEEEGSS